MKKKLIAILTIAAVTAALAACAKPAEQTSEKSEAAAESASVEESTSAEESASSGAVTGGWEINEEENVAWAPEDAMDAFNAGVEGWTGQDFTLIAYLGSQVVSGTNYMFLCKGTLVTANPVTALKVVTVYQDLNGEAKITNVADFNIADYTDAEDTGAADEALVGGWSHPNDAVSITLPSPVAEAFDQAVEPLTGADYYPVAYLGKQIVSGTNYAILCQQTLVTADPVTRPCLVYIYAPLSGDAEVSNIVALDLTQFTE